MFYVSACYAVYVMEGSKNENLNPEPSKTIEGYPPLKLIRRESEIWTEDGRRLIPHFKIGPQQYHVDLFVEYERTFGRGKAFAVTHNPISGGIYADARKEHQELAGLMASTVSRGTEEECQAFIERIKDYRKNITHYLMMSQPTIRREVQ